MSRREYTSEDLELLDSLIPSPIFKYLLSQLLNAASKHKESKNNSEKAGSLISELAKLEVAIAIQRKLNNPKDENVFPNLNIANNAYLNSVWGDCKREEEKILNEPIPFREREFEEISFEEWKLSALTLVNHAEQTPHTEEQLKEMHGASEEERRNIHLKKEEIRKHEIERSKQEKKQRKIDRIWERKIVELTPTYRFNSKFIVLFLAVNQERGKRSKFCEDVKRIFRLTYTIKNSIEDSSELSERLLQEKGKASTHIVATDILQQDVAKLTSKVDEVLKQNVNLNQTLLGIQEERQILNETLCKMNQKLERQEEERGDLNATLADIRQQLAHVEGEKSILFDLVQRRNSSSEFTATSFKSRGYMNKSIFNAEAKRQIGHARSLLQKNLSQERFNCMDTICTHIKRQRESNKPFFHTLLETILMPETTNQGDEDSTIQNFLNENPDLLVGKARNSFESFKTLPPNNIPQESLKNYFKAVYTMYKYSGFYYPADMSRYNKFVDLKNNATPAIPSTPQL